MVGDFRFARTDEEQRACEIAPDPPAEGRHRQERDDGHHEIAGGKRERRRAAGDAPPSARVPGRRREEQREERRCQQRHARAPAITGAFQVQHPGRAIPDDHAPDHNLRLTPEANQRPALADNDTTDNLPEQPGRDGVGQFVQQNGQDETGRQRCPSHDASDARLFETGTGAGRDRRPGRRRRQAQLQGLPAAAVRAASALGDILPARLAARTTRLLIGLTKGHAKKSIDRALGEVGTRRLLFGEISVSTRPSTSFNSRPSSRAIVGAISVVFIESSVMPALIAPP